MLLLGEGSEATEPYNKYDKIRPHSIRSKGSTSVLSTRKIRSIYSHPFFGSKFLEFYKFTIGGEFVHFFPQTFYHFPTNFSSTTLFYTNLQSSICIDEKLCQLGIKAEECFWTSFKTFFNTKHEEVGLIRSKDGRLLYAPEENLRRSEVSTIQQLKVEAKLNH